MNKKLAIVEQNLNNADIYVQQIKSLFSNTVNIVKYSIDSGEIEKGIAADVIVVTSYDVFEKIKKYIKMPSEIIFGNRTISKPALDKIMRIPKDREVIVLDENIERSKQMIAVLYQIGVRHIQLFPAFQEEAGKVNNKTIIVLGGASCIAEGAKEIINIGNTLLDISTIIDIGMRLNLDHILNRQNIRESYKEIVTVNIGFAEILGKTNRFESYLDILLQVIDDGVIGVNSQGEVFTYNDKARKIIGLEMEEVRGKNGIHLFSQIPFGTVIKNNKSVKEKLEKINGYDVVVSVDPILHSGVLYGAVAVLQSFSEEERKQHKIRTQLIGKGYKAKYTFKDIVSESEAIKKCKDIAKRMANSNSSILITGESGTGKEMFAQAIHNSSNRKEFQFVAVNCGALPESLLESELFGYEEGAFTGARKGGKPGLFELAHKGTLFLDEIGEMPINLQMRLLRVLQEREVMRLGGDRVISVDIRLITATNRNFKDMIRERKFREDLYYRLNVLPLSIPPLRTRTEDILPLVQELKKIFNYNFQFTESAKQVFLNHSWKGNVRELRNYIEYIVNLGISEVGIQDLPFEFDKDIVRDDKKIVVKEFLNLPNGAIKKYRFVLEELEKGFLHSKRLGRRSLSILAKEKGIFISEQEIRRILMDLEKQSMVEIFPGRSGSIITELGREILKRLI